MKSNLNVFLFLLFVIMAAGAFALFVRQAHDIVEQPFVSQSEEVPPAPALVVVATSTQQ